jgi:hypothetical protein
VDLKATSTVPETERRLKYKGTMPAGRPPSYSQEKAAAICAQMAEGRSLVSILDSDEMPGYSTVMRWLDDYPEFRDKYARAAEQRAERMAEEMLQISDDGKRDFSAGEGGDQFNGEHVQRARLRVDTRKWLLSKMQPKKYGDKVQNEHTGAGGGPMELTVRFIED